MSIRVVLIIVTFFVVLFACGYVAQLNGTVLQEKILFHRAEVIAQAPGSDPTRTVVTEKRWELSVWAVVLGSFFSGFGMALTLQAFRSSKRAVMKLRDARATRKQNSVRDRVELLYAEGLQAVLADKPERAEGCFREVLAQDSQHFETLMAYGELLRGASRAREATDLHRRAAEVRAADMRPLFALAADWQADGDLDKARRELEKVIQRNPKESFRAQRELRNLLMTAGRWEEAKKLHDKIEANARDEESRQRQHRIGLGIRYEIAQGHHAKQQWREAERELRSILKADGGHVPAALALGETLLASGDRKAAVLAWQNGFVVSESPIFLARLEDYYLARVEPQVLLEVLRTLVNRARNPAVPSFFLGKVYLRLEMIDEAEAMFGGIEQKANDSLLLRYFDAKILERRGRNKDAAEAYRSLIKDSLVLGLKFKCRVCGELPEKYEARCSGCGEWCTLDVALQGVVATSQESRRILRPEWAAAP